MQLPLTITATTAERMIGRGIALTLFVDFAGEGVAATAELDGDGEVAEITGTYPADLYNALVEIACEALADLNGGPSATSVTTWHVDAAGAVTFAGDVGAAAA